MNPFCLPEFISGQVHSVEVAQHITAMDIFGNQLELTERSFGISVVLQIGQRHLKHAALQTIRSDSGSLGTVYQSLTDLTGREHVRGLHIVPILTGERIHNLLFRSFFASFGGTLIFADRHDYTSRSKRTETLDV